MSPLTDQPHVPLEVAENIIDQLVHHVDTLRSCALTCRGWLPRSRYHLMTSIRIQAKDDLSSMYDYLSSTPRIASIVRNVSISPADTEGNCLYLKAFPLLLLSRLPKLQSCKMDWFHDHVSFHAANLLGTQTYLRVEELRLENIRFRTGGELARLLTAFPLLRLLHFEWLSVSDLEHSVGSLNAIRRFGGKCSRLSEVTKLLSSASFSACAPRHWKFYSTICMILTAILRKMGITQAFSRS
ncbi:hypothetical protein L227DRAFT_608788 [Lentinus tigrinus ALCF2SS1-6]|uniref:F-box domain-containing protein n=1 Tax=Lentinus tigrinus ALCF2SS1-6 TaxID=1328759 RepID=A0A5C2SJV7_9APHY|nr:hypothetical protein L227DRAFT_608788 [Lentinus tigrinus ALCF2SS1-6]